MATGAVGNLAGAIALGGKRESVLADLPQEISHAGDVVAQELEKQKLKRAELAKQQKDKKASEYEKNLAKAEFDLGGLHPNDNKEISNDQFWAWRKTTR